MKALALLPALLVAGCLSVDRGYAPNVSLTRHTIPEPHTCPVSFSVELEEARDDFWFRPDAIGLRDKVRDALEATGLFSDVRLAEKPEPDTYHIAFTFHTGGTDGPTSGSAWNWALKSLTLIPVWDNATFDGAAVVYLRGKPIHAAGAAECLQKFIWLPLAPLGLLWSDPVAWHFTEKGVINNLVNDVSAYHRQRFLPPPKRTAR